MPREADLNNPITPGGTTPPPSWVGKKVRMKEEAQDLLWMTIFAGVDHFIVTFDTPSQIKLDGFGGALFNKTDFNLIP